MRLAVTFLVALFAPMVAHADDVSAARAHYERGTTLYDLQRYDEAAREYEAAYEAKHDPALLFNIGQAYRLAGDFKRAIGSYRSFLRRVPDASNRAEIEARIAEMLKQLDEQRKTQEKPPTEPQAATELKNAAPAATPNPPVEEAKAAPAPVPTPPTTKATARPARRDRTKLIAGITVAAVGLAALAAGVGVEVAAHSAFSAIDSPSPGYKFDAGQESFYQAGEPAGYVLIGVGAAAAIAGVTIALLGVREQRAHRLVVAPMAGSAFAGASVRVGF